MLPPNRRVRTRTHGGVAGKVREDLPMQILLPPLHLAKARRLTTSERPTLLIYKDRSDLGRIEYLPQLEVHQ